MVIISDTSLTDEKSVRKMIRDLILELAPEQSVAEFKGEDLLVEGLGYHSLALMELAFTLEDEFGLDVIDEKQIAEIVTAGDVENHVIEELQRKGKLK